MPQDPIATLIQSNDPEGNEVTWQDVGSTPARFLAWIVKRLAIDVSKIKSSFPIFFGRDVPTGVEFGKLHIDTNLEPRVGINTSQGYKYIDRYPRNVILGWRGSSPIPTFFTRVPDTEITLLELPPNRPNSLVWVVYVEN